LDELQAAILRVKLQYLDTDNAARMEIAHKYDQGLSGTRLVTPKVRKGLSHVYHLYVVRDTEREHLRAALKKKDILALVHYPVPVHLQPAYNQGPIFSLPETDKAAIEILSLPLYPELRDKEVQDVIDTIREACL
jgi:dTDP-4-amino-4,6-dideoxygalactose transaminase